MLSNYWIDSLTKINGVTLGTSLYKLNPKLKLHLSFNYKITEFRPVENE